MPKPEGPLAFLTVETGAAAFLAPVWRRWLREPPSPWIVLAAAPARRWVEGQPDLAPLPLVVVDENDEGSGVFDGTRPARLLVSASARSLEAGAITWARRNGVPVAAFVDTWYGYARRFGAGPLPDRIGVIDEAGRADAVAEGLPNEILRILGHPAWETVRPLPPGPRGSVLFADAPVARDYGNSLGYTERECRALMLAAARAAPSRIVRLCASFHPSSPDEIAGMESVAPAGQKLTEFEAVCGMFSSLMVDAFLSGRKVVSLQPGAEGLDMCPLSRHGLVPKVGDVPALLAALNQPISSPAALAERLAGSASRVDNWMRNGWS